MINCLSCNHYSFATVKESNSIFPNCSIHFVFPKVIKQKHDRSDPETQYDNDVFDKIEGKNKTGKRKKKHLGFFVLWSRVNQNKMKSRLKVKEMFLILNFAIQLITAFHQKSNTISTS